MTNEYSNKMIRTIEENVENENFIAKLSEVAVKLAEKNMVNESTKQGIFKAIKKKSTFEKIDPSNCNVKNLYTYRLFQMYKKGIGVEKNPQAALDCLIKIAQGGITRVATEIVLLHKNGNEELNIKPDKDEIINWCFKVAEYNCLTPLYYLALQACGKKVPPMYDFGMNKSFSLAIKCLTTLNKYGDINWKIRYDIDRQIKPILNSLHDVKSDDASFHSIECVIADLYYELTDYNNYNQMSSIYSIFTLLGNIYLELKDYKNAIKNFRKAITQKSLNAIINLSEMYQQGLGLTKNQRKAFKLKKIAADSIISTEPDIVWDLSDEEYLKSIQVLEDVADAYYSGRGVKKSLSAAMRYYTEMQKDYRYENIPEEYQKKMIEKTTKSINEIRRLESNQKSYRH